MYDDDDDERCGFLSLLSPVARVSDALLLLWIGVCLCIWCWVDIERRGNEERKDWEKRNLERAGILVFGSFLFFSSFSLSVGVFFFF